MTSDASREHPATIAQQQRAWERGDVATSPELTAALTILVAIALLATFAQWLGDQFQAAVRETWRAQAAEGAGRQSLVDAVGAYGTVLLAIGGACILLAIVAFVSGWAQVGFRIFWMQLRPNIERFSPGRSVRMNASGLIQNTIRAVVIGIILAVFVGSVWSRRHEWIGLMHHSTLNLDRWFGLIVEMLLPAAGLLAGLGLIELKLEHWLRQRRLRMTEQEHREDLAAAAINPFVADYRAQRGRGTPGLLQQLQPVQLLITDHVGNLIGVSQLQDGSHGAEIAFQASAIGAARARRVAGQLKIPVIADDFWSLKLLRSDPGELLDANATAVLREKLRSRR